MLNAYLREAMRLKWKPGAHDCSAWPAKWAGIDLPAYSTDAQALALVGEAGGLVALWDRCIGDTLARTESPKRGDIGIVSVEDEGGSSIEVGAIFTGERWAMVTIVGLLFCSPQVLAAWEVPCLAP